MVSQRDIAEALGVSIATVSTVLSNKATAGGISRTTEERVKKMADRLGYRPNLTARALRTRKHYTIGLLLHNPNELLYAELLTVLQARLTKRRYAGVAAFWNSLDDVDAAFQSVISRGVDGIITCHEDLSGVPAEIPVVTFENCNPQHDSICRDGKGAVRNALIYLLELGHRRLGMINMNREEQEANVNQVLAGYVNVEPLLWVSDSKEINYLAKTCEGIGELLSLPPAQRPTALLCRNDTVAMQALSVAGCFGLRVPQELSVIGFDGVSIGSLTNPPLTTLGTPTDEIARQLTELLWRRLKQPLAPVKHLLLDKALIVRESCGPPPAARP